MAGLAELAQRRKELEELFGFVEDIGYPPDLAAKAMECGLGDPASWIRPLRDMIGALDRGQTALSSRPLFVRFIEAQVLHIDTWHKRNPLLTLEVKWQSKCSPAKVSSKQRSQGILYSSVVRM